MNKIMKDRQKHINAVTKMICKYLDKKVVGTPHQILIMHDIIVECFALQDLFIRKHYKGVEADDIIMVTIGELIKGFQDKDKEVKEMLKEGDGDFRSFFS